MKARTLGALSIFAVCIAWSGSAFCTTESEDTLRTTTSRDYFSTTPETQRPSTNTEDQAALARFGYRVESGPAIPQPRHSVCDTCELPSVSLGAADVYLRRDEDRDGYYHHFEVGFDVSSIPLDTSLFARLYLSYEGGPWNTLYRTSDFTLGDIHEDNRRIVETSLDNGYPTGYYDLKIELFDAYSGRFLIDLGPNDENRLRAIPLEDMGRDGYDWGYYSGVGFYAHGSGATGGSVLLLLGALLALRRRFCF